MKINSFAREHVSGRQGQKTTLGLTQCRKKEKGIKATKKKAKPRHE